MIDKLDQFIEEQVKLHKELYEECTCDEMDYGDCWYRYTREEQEQIRKDFLIRQLANRVEAYHDSRADASPEEGVE